MVKLEGCVTYLKEEEKRDTKGTHLETWKLSYIYLFHKDDNIAFLFTVSKHVLC
jgi:hypothetical protein